MGRVFKLLLQVLKAVSVIGFLVMLFFGSLAFSMLENALSVIFFQRVRIKRRNFITLASSTKHLYLRSSRSWALNHNYVSRGDCVLRSEHCTCRAITEHQPISGQWEKPWIGYELAATMKNNPFGK